MGSGKLDDHPTGPRQLGERMCKVFDNITEPTLLIGSDCPYMEEKDLIEAGHALEKNDLVLGPAKDGGYWMIGMKTLPLHYLKKSIGARAQFISQPCHALKNKGFGSGKAEC